MALSLQRFNYEYSPATGYFDRYTEGQSDDPLYQIMKESERDNTTRNLALITGGTFIVVAVVVALILKRKKK